MSMTKNYYHDEINKHFAADEIANENRELDAQYEEYYALYVSINEITTYDLESFACGMEQHYADNQIQILPKGEDELPF